MAVLVSGKTKIEIEPIKATLVTFPKLKAHADNLRSISKQDPIEQTRRGFELLNKMPGLSEIITSGGGWNPDTVAREEQRLGNTEAAIEHMTAQLHEIAALSPEVAMSLFFPPLHFCIDPETMRACIAVVRDTFNPSDLSNAQIKLLQSNDDSEFWQNVESEGLYDYCYNFCEVFK